ncbi:tripartite tricarboxylate transporter TctB family protein [Kocuria carniphila]|uniref:tripartite tricarboxylate transporter TctB family protein n=1 Tax=Kocuria carniphila TaxID=262208 RepID=UPI0034DB1418
MSSSPTTHDASSQEADLEFEEEAPRAGVTTARLGALVPLVLGVSAAFVSFGLGIGTLGDPGAGLWPFAISVAMIVASLIAVLRAKQDRDVEAFDRGVVPVALSVVSLVVYAALLPVIGFEIPTALLLVFWIKVLGKEGWRPAIAVAIVATVAVYALFVILFAVPIPHLF